MTPEERFHRIEEKHQALAESLELLTHVVLDVEKQTAANSAATKANAAAIAANADAIAARLEEGARQNRRIDRIVILYGRMADTADEHEERIHRLEKAS